MKERIDQMAEVKSKLLMEGEQFLISEASILDSGDFKKWLSLLTDDILYQIPIRITRERNAPSHFSRQSFHMYEDKNSLELRIARVYTEYNFAEDPPSRSRHFLTNFHIVNIEHASFGTELTIKCNLLVFRNKFDLTSHDLISGEREDVIRQENGCWKLAKRTVWLDHTTMAISNLGIFL